MTNAPRAPRVISFQTGVNAVGLPTFTSHIISQPPTMYGKDKPVVRTVKHF